jgi:hypothetical protein
MANYLYKGLCYAEPSGVFRAMAADCDPHTADGRSLSCTVNTDGYTITASNGTTTTTLDVIPTLIDCIPEMQNAYDLGWMVAGALIAVGIIGLLIKASK